MRISMVVFILVLLSSCAPVPTKETDMKGASAIPDIPHKKERNPLPLDASLLRVLP